jgi:hypothetical protein
MKEKKSMNERIKQLAEQAKAESSQWLGSKPAITITYDELEKFAELIIKECADVATINQFQYDSAGNYVLKHFGVEE